MTSLALGLRPMDTRRWLVQLVADAEANRHDDDDDAELDQYLFAIEPIDRIILERRIAQETVNGVQREHHVGEQMQRLPRAPAQDPPLLAQNRRRDHEREDPKRERADGRLVRLLRRLRRP